MKTNDITNKVNVNIQYKKKIGSIANETTIHKRTTDTEINNYRSPYGLQQWARPYRIVNYKTPRNYKCKTIQTSKLTA